MKKLFFLFLVLLMGIGPIFAQIQIGDLYYNLNDASRSAEVTYQNFYDSTNYAGLTIVTIPETVEYNSVTYTVRSIKQYAFYGCCSLTSVEIPYSVRSIGSGAFMGCSSLSIVTFGRIVYEDDDPGTCWLNSIGDFAFQDCKNLASIELPSLVNNIGKSAFRGCSSIVSIEIPNFVTSIEQELFRGCSSLISVTIPDGISGIGDRAFYDCSALASIEIPNSVSSIGKNAFNGCSNMISIKIGSGVTSIRDYAFRGCSELTNVYISDLVAWCGIEFLHGNSNPLYNAKHFFLNDVEITDLDIPSSITSIGKYAFNGCSGITSVNIPSCITCIGNRAFSECSGITSVTIPSSITSIGESAFYKCSGLASVYISDLAAWCAIDFEDADSPYGCYANPLVASGYNQYKDLYLNGELVTNLVIPSNVTSIPNYLFCTCKSITAVTIPSGVIHIGAAAFNDCPNLKELTISETVTNIDGGAFMYCGALMSVTCRAINPPICHESSASVFYTYHDCVLYVPEESIDLYKQADGWKEFDNIQAITDEETAIENPSAKFGESRKLLRDGQILILRGDHTYTLTGQQTK